MGRICQEAAFASNQLATLLSCPQFLTTFREEYYGFAPPVARKSGVAAVTPSSLDASSTSSSRARSRARSRAERSDNLARLQAVWGSVKGLQVRGSVKGLQGAFHGMRGPTAE